MIRSAIMAALLIMPMAAGAKDKPLDPKQAYVLIDIESLDDSVMKGADVPGSVTLGRYDAAKQDIRGGDLSPDTALPKKISPHLAIERSPVVKSKAVRQYLVAIEPDIWVIEGANGTAFSLGSLQFAVNAGEVIDLGVVKPAVDWVEGEGAQSAGKVMMGALLFGSMKPKNLRPVKLDWHARTASDLPVPASLAARTVIPVAFSPGAKFGNYLGGLINRIGGRGDRAATAAAAPLADTSSAETSAAAEVSPQVQ